VPGGTEQKKTRNVFGDYKEGKRSFKFTKKVGKGKTRITGHYSKCTKIYPPKR
jgi:hypothetical protein